MAQTDLDYFRRRERQHRDRAEACADPAAKGLHRRFAEGYADRIRELLAPFSPA